MLPLASDAQVNLYSADPEALATFYVALVLTERFRFPATGKPDQLEMSVGSIDDRKGIRTRLVSKITQPNASAA